MKIDANKIRKFKPCEGGFKNYLKVFGEKGVYMIEFLESKQIPTEDKHWIINRAWSDKDFQRTQRDYALVCASRAIENCNVQEVKDFFTLIILINQTEDFSLRNSTAYKAADSAAYGAEYWSSYRAVYWAASIAASSAASSTASSTASSAAERKVQIEIMISLLEETKKEIT